MSNTVAWRAKPRTSKPNSRQKRNGLFLDAHPDCACGSPATEVHHDLPYGHDERYDNGYVHAVCRPCHVEIHRPAAVAA